MRKIAAWFQIIVCSLFLLMFVLSAIILIPGLLDDTGTEMRTSEMMTTGMGFIVIIPLLFFGLINGIKKIKKNRVTQLIPFDDTLDLHLNGQITYKDYRNLILGLTFKKPAYLIFISIITLFLFSFLISSETSITQNGTNYFPFLFLGILILTPAMTLVQIKKLYKTNKLFHQHLTYYLTNESLHIKGETIDSTQTWSNFYKVKETNVYFMLFTGNTIATLLDKKMFKPAEIEKLRSFLKSLAIERE